MQKKFTLDNIQRETKNFIVSRTSATFGRTSFLNRLELSFKDEERLDEELKMYLSYLVPLFHHFIYINTTC